MVSPGLESGVRVWEQCDGEEYTGPTECSRGLICKKIDESYSQCEYNDMATGIPVWGRCGGSADKNGGQYGGHYGGEYGGKYGGEYGGQYGGQYGGPTECVEGTRCTMMNASLFQCLPLA
jgi:hypothetical protein